MCAIRSTIVMSHTISMLLQTSILWTLVLTGDVLAGREDNGTQVLRSRVPCQEKDPFRSRMNFTEPWEFCMLGERAGNWTLICDRSLPHAALISFFKFWRLHPDDITSLHLNCNTSPSGSCFCMHLPDTWYEALLCQPELFLFHHCSDIVLTEYVLQALPNLRNMWINGLDLRGTSKYIFHSNMHLESLHLVDTKLTREELPSWRHLPDLMSLKLSGIQLGDVTQGLRMCGSKVDPAFIYTNLHELVLEGASIKELPRQGICPDCTNLTVLSLSSNELSALDDYSFSGLRSLENLDISSNLLTQLSQTHFSCNMNIRKLNMSRNLLTILDIEFASVLHHLKYLDVSHNFIHAIIGYIRTLPNIHVIFLNNNSLMEIPHHTFQKASSLERIDMSQNHIRLIADEAFLGTTLKYLDASWNRIQQIPILNMEFQPISYIRWLSGAPLLEGILDTPFTFLDLSHNEIQDLPPSVFEPLCMKKFLRSESEELVGLILRLTDNSIKTLDIAALNCLSLMEISLKNNNIVDVIQTTPAKMLLNKIILENNPIRYIQAGAFDSVLEYTDSVLSEYDGQHIYKSIHLTLSNNDLVKLDNLTLPGNICNSMFDLDHNELTELGSQFRSFMNVDGSCTRGYNIIELNLAFNAFEILPNDFCPNTTIAFLDLRYNLITEKIFQQDTFATCDIRYLDLSCNRIESLEHLLSSPYLCGHLSEIMLSNNPIKTIPPRLQPPGDMCHMIEIDLSDCDLIVIPPDTFDGLNKLEKIDLRNNLLTHVGDLIKPKGQFDKNVHVILHGNPIECSCHMRWLKMQPEHRNIYQFDACLDVVRQHIMPFDEVPLDHFVCVVNDSAICDPRCVCLSPSISDDIDPTYIFCNDRALHKTPSTLPARVVILYLENNDIPLLDFHHSGHVRYTKTVYLQNSHIATISPTAFVDFVHLRILYLDYNNITILNMSTFNCLTVLKVLSLSHNRIKEIIVPPRLEPDNLQYLFTLSLNGNQLQEIPEDVRKYLESLRYLYNLSLSNNPWACTDCFQRGMFKNWLFFGLGGRQRIRDYDDIQCIQATHPMADCWDRIKEANLRHAMHLNFTWISGILLMLIGVGLILLWRYKYQARVRLVNIWPSLRSCRAELELPFDAFIAYDRNNTVLRNWVINVLLPWLEEPRSGPAYRVFVMERDATVIADREDIIHTAIRHSKRTIIMVSHTFPSDGDTYIASREAEYFSLQNSKHRVTVILYDVSIVQARGMDELLCEYIDRKNVLIASQHAFWKQLFYFLPHQPNDEERQRHHDNINLQETRHLFLNRSVTFFSQNQTTAL